MINKDRVEELKEVAKKYAYKSDFRKGSPKEWRQAKKSGHFKEICSHMPKKKGIRKITDGQIYEKAQLCNNNSEFQNNYSEYYNAALRRGILDKVRENMSVQMVWTLEAIKEVMAKCKTKTEFYDRFPSAYNAAHRRDDYEDLCSHMQEIRHFWSNEEIYEKGGMCNGRSEFEHRYPGAYRAAIRRGILEDVCKDMVLLMGTSVAEIVLFGRLKSVYPNAKKVRKRIKIEGKPHIQGFEIDVYIPELKKGIEYDGTWYHSFEKLKENKDKNKIPWPDEDIRNLHQIKDDYFESIGIELFHITEAEWNIDNEACIQRCLAFLAKKN